MGRSGMRLRGCAGHAKLCRSQYGTAAMPRRCGTGTVFEAKRTKSIKITRVDLTSYSLQEEPNQLSQN